MTKSISPQALHDALTDGGEIALLDVREEGVFAKRHILRACPMALSRLEIRVAKLVPRRSADWRIGTRPFRQCPETS